MTLVDVLRDYWYVAAFVAAELVTLGYTWLRAFAYRRAARREGLVGDTLYETAERVRLAKELEKCWRPFDVLVILYHFPVVVPTAWARKDQSVPLAIMCGVTPALYSAITFLVLRARA